MAKIFEEVWPLLLLALVLSPFLFWDYVKWREKRIRKATLKNRARFLRDEVYKGREIPPYGLSATDLEALGMEY